MENINKAMTEIYDKYGVFFAFSDHQYYEKAQVGVKYTSMGAGMICPTEHAKTVYVELREAINTHRAWEIETKGKERIIKDELVNQEAYYIGSIETTVEALKGYDITTPEIIAVYKATNDNYA